jgi:hypothetical protein
MAPKRRLEELIGDVSSPDPLGNSVQNNEPIFRTPTRRSISPRKAQLQFDAPSSRAPSPQKTVILDPLPDSGTSPWRIKVTVQAEPTEEEENEETQDSKIRQSPIRVASKRVKTTTVPLKDHDGETKFPRKGRGRPRKSGTPAARRPPTPARRVFGHDYDEEDDPDFQLRTGGLKPDGAPLLSPKRKRGRPRSITPAAPHSRKASANEEEQAAQLEPRKRSTSKDPVSEYAASATQRPDLAPNDKLTRSSRTPSPRKRTPIKESSFNFSSLPSRAPLSIQPEEAHTTSQDFDEIYNEEPDQNPQNNESDDEEGSAKDQITREESTLDVEQNFDTEDGILESAEEDSMDEDIEINDEEVIGDETMMKSMDMTMVSPRSLYSKLDIDSSRLEARKVADPSSPKSNISSSPHVKFSSPLVAPTPDNVRRSRAPSSSRDLEPPSRSNLKVTARSSSPFMQPNTAFRPLPTPDSDEKMSDDENPMLRQGDESTDAREARWQRERQQISHQARQVTPSRMITIDDEVEEEDDDIAEQSDADEDMWQEAANQSSSYLQHENSYVSSRPSIASYRETKRKSNDEQNRADSSAEAIEEEDDTDEPDPQEKSKESSEISMLFNAFAKQRTHPSTQQEEDESEAQSPDTSKENLSAFLRRKVTNIMDAVDFSFTTPGKRKQVDPSPRPVQAATSKIPVNFGSSLLEDGSLPAIPTYSPKQSSPLKHRLDLDDSQNTSTDEESSVLSDAHQLLQESRAAKRQALQSQVSQSQSTQRIYQRPNPPMKSLLKQTQERKARAAIGLSSNSQSVHMQFDSRVNEEPPAPSSQDKNEPISNGVLSRIWTHVSRSSPTEHTAESQAQVASSVAEQRSYPVRPAHPLLRHFRLLPRNHPWTENHFQALFALYKHWQTHVHMYSPAEAHNAVLLTPKWQKYIDMEFSNWGYELQLSSSLIVLAALFAQLLVLEDDAEYASMYGEHLEFGFVASRTMDVGEIEPWHVALRLFAVAVGDVVRDQEAKGAVIDRRPALRWRFKGQWFWKRGWCWFL